MIGSTTLSAGVAAATLPNGASVSLALDDVVVHGHTQAFSTFASTLDNTISPTVIAAGSQTITGKQGSNLIIGTLVSRW